MTYGSEHGKTSYGEGSLEIGSREFFDRLDQEFYSWNKPLHRERPFDRLFPYNRYGAGAQVLEIGCGLGTMAMLWAQNGGIWSFFQQSPRFYGARLLLPD